MHHFYSHDGTWRTSQPSWRVIINSAQNVRGAQHSLTLDNPALLRTLQPGRRLQRAATPAADASHEEAAAAAAASYVALNFKDQKLSGFANETLSHTDLGDRDLARWGRLGIMTRERLTTADRFGDICIPVVNPATAPKGGLKPATFPKQPCFPKVEERDSEPPYGSFDEHSHAPRTSPMSQDPYAASKPANAEASGFTRRPLLHSSDELTGGFVYHAPDTAKTPEPEVSDVQVVGNKLKTGFTINNANVAAEPPVGQPEHNWG